jgi:O-antigen ligase
MHCCAMLFAWLVAWQTTGRPDRARTVLRGVSIAGLLAAGYAIAQYRVGSMVRPPGTLGDPGYLANWLLMAVFLSLALAKMETHRGWRGLAYTAAALALAGVFVSGARAALPGLAVGVLVWLGCSGFRPPRRALFAAVAVVLCGAAFYFSPADPWAGARPRLWRDALSMAAERPLEGYGPEVFLAEFPHFESKALAQADPDLVYESPHNILLDALVSQGVPGLLLLCGLCAAGFAAAWKRKAGWLAAALAAGVAGQQFTAFTMPTAVLFLTIVALAVGLAEAPGVPQPSPAIAGVAPLLVLALVYFALRLTMADHALAETRRLLDARELRAATAEYETYWFWRLPGSSADVWYSRSWLEVARSTPDTAVRTQAMAISEQAAERATGDAEEPFAA